MHISGTPRGCRNVYLKLMLFLALASELLANPYPKIRAYNFQSSGAYTLIAGKRTIFMFRPQYAFDFTCVAATDVCTVTGSIYTPVNGQTGTTDSTGTLPGGISTMVQFAWPTYALCNASGFTFKLKQNDCSGALVDITSTGTGTHTFSMYAYNSQRIYLDAPPTGLPASTSFSWRTGTGGTGYTCHDAAPTSGGKIYDPPGGDGSENPLCMDVTLSSGASAGTGTGSIVLCEDAVSTNCRTFTFPYNVAVLTPVTPTPPVSFPAIPGLTNWQAKMTATNGMGGSDNGAGPADYCTPRSSPTQDWTNMPEQSVVYYGWGLLFWNIGKYTSDSTWNNCGTRAGGYMKFYIDSNWTPPTLGVPAYKQFCEVMYRATRITGDASYAAEATRLQGTTYLYYGVESNLSFAREMAYGLSTTVCLNKYGSITPTYWNDLRDTVYGFLLRATEASAGNRLDSQTFYIGLMMDAIIADWQITGDVRAPYVIKRAWDYIQSNYDAMSHTQMWDAGVDGGPACTTTALWFQGDPIGACFPTINGQKLQNLSSHAASWYYALTGNTTYRDQGDDWFEHSMDASLYTGKEAAQNYYYSFNYVCWRSGACTYNQWYGDAASTGGGTKISGAVRITGSVTVH